MTDQTELERQRKAIDSGFDRRKALGLKRKQFWCHPADFAQIQKLVDKLNGARGINTLDARRRDYNPHVKPVTESLDDMLAPFRKKADKLERDQKKADKAFAEQLQKAREAASKQG